MFSVRASEYAAMPIFLSKMALVALAAANFGLFVALERRSGVSTAVRLSAIASIGLWLGVLICGRFIGFL